MDGEICIGCGRTLGEIARWGSLSEPERLAIMKILPARLASCADEQADRKAQTDQDQKAAERDLKLPLRS